MSKNNRSLSIFFLFISAFFVASYSTMDAMITGTSNEAIMIGIIMRIGWAGGAIAFVILSTYYAFKK